MEINEDELTVTVLKSIKILPKVTPKMWKREEVLVLLDVYESTLTQSMGNSTERETELWLTVSDKLHKQGIEASPAHCESKWNLLYKTFTANPAIGGAFFVKVKQILDIIASMEKSVQNQEENEYLYKEEMLEEEPEMEEVIMEEPHEGNSSISYTTERVSDTPTEAIEDGMQQLLERLCSKIDTLTELQHRQEARLEEVYQMQRINESHLLEIKKRIG